jgi:hypothetical protein
MKKSVMIHWLKKLLLAGAAVLAVVLVGGLAAIIFLHEDENVSTEIIIDASLAQVWKVLDDTAAYPEWNSLIRKIDGDLKTNGTVWVTIKLPESGSDRYQVKILGYIPEHEIRWEHDFAVPRLFYGKHKIIIDAVNENQTILRHGKEFKGLLVGPLSAGHLRQTRDGFEKMNKELKMRVENSG